MVKGNDIDLQSYFMKTENVRNSKLTREKQRLLREENIMQFFKKKIILILTIVGLLLILAGMITAKLWRDYKSNAFDEAIQLAQWYEENGNTQAAISTYAEAMQMLDYKENQISAKNPSFAVSETANLSIKIEAVVGFTKDVIISVSGENLTPAGSEVGKVSGEATALRDDTNYKTTEWFTIDSSKESLLLTGGFNCAIWQFINAEGEIVTIEDNSIFNDMSAVAINRKSYSTVNIPDGFTRCRVTYLDQNEQVELDDILIIYGDMMQGYTGEGSYDIKVPDITDNQYILFENNIWNLYEDDSVKCELDLPKPDIYKNCTLFQMSGEICGVVTITTSADEIPNVLDKTKQYGIRRSVDKGIALCQRLGDAQGMHFDYVRGQNDGESIENDFDYAYPWSEMKLCNVGTNGDYKITYADEAGFVTDGSNGNVMVEIPKFYVKRTVEDGIEEIWISGTCYEGYEIDPVFVENGEEKDYVYISAYLGSECDNCIKSVSGSYPVVRIEYGDLLRKARNNGEGYDEINYFMYSAIQKLFLVETGCTDSTSLFAGETDAYFYSNAVEIEKTGAAIRSENSTNVIVVNDVAFTRKLQVGASVIFLNTQEAWSSYDYNNSAAFREITDVRVIDSAREIVFDGPPMDIIKGETVVASYPSLAGKTDEIEYCTGAAVNNNGRHGFKYRNIENLYGSALIMLSDDAFLNNGSFYFKDCEGNIQRLAGTIPEQSKTLNIAENGFQYANMNCIKRMSYDERWPSIMMPTEVGASSYSFYCDYWYYKSDTDDIDYYLCVGSAEDNRRIGGLFQMRGIVDSYEYKGNFMSGRIMYR